MSADLFYDYIFKGNSEDLANVVETYFKVDWFNPNGLDVEYPETFSYRKQYTAEEIINNGITEMKIRILVVFRMRYKNQHVDWSILKAFQEKYPNLEISYQYVDESEL